MNVTFHKRVSTIFAVQKWWKNKLYFWNSVLQLSDTVAVVRKSGYKRRGKKTKKQTFMCLIAQHLWLESYPSPHQSDWAKSLASVRSLSSECLRRLEMQTRIESSHYMNKIAHQQKIRESCFLCFCQEKQCPNITDGNVMVQLVDEILQNFTDRNFTDGNF